MAAKVDALKDDFLTCPLCLQLYREPKVLFCQHTFCLPCLQEYIDHNLGVFLRWQCVCPLCKKSTAVPDGDARLLQSNFLVVGLLNFLEGNSNDNAHSAESSLPSEPPGDECPLCEVTRVCVDYCHNCQLWLCASCKRSHSKVPDTKWHNVCSMEDMHAQSMGKLQQFQELVHGLLLETDSKQTVIFNKQQALADQMSETTFAVSTIASRLQSAVEDMQHQLLIQMGTKVIEATDGLSKQLADIEQRRNQLEKVRERVKDAHHSGDTSQTIILVRDLQRELGHLTVLPDVSAGAMLQGVDFHPSRLLLTSLQADTLGHFSTYQNTASLESQRFPGGGGTVLFSPVSTLQCSLDVVTGIAAFGQQSEKFVYVIGNKKVFCSTPRLQYSINSYAFCGQEVFKKPWSVALTPDKKVLVTDAGPCPGEGFVAVCDLDGHFISYLAKGLSLPRGIAVGSDSRVYVCDQDDRCVYILSNCAGGAIRKVLKKDSAGKFYFLSPMDVAVASNGDIVVSDDGRFIKVFSPDFMLKKIYESPLPKSQLWGVCTDQQGRVYVADWKYGIQVLSSTREAKFEGLLLGLESAGIVEPTSIACGEDCVLVGNSSAQIFKGVFMPSEDM